MLVFACLGVALTLKNGARCVFGSKRVHPKKWVLFCDTKPFVGRYRLFFSEGISQDRHYSE